MCDHVATCLRAKVVPNEANVLDALQNASEWPPVTKNFLQRGGSVASVALTLFQGAMIQDELAGDVCTQKSPLMHGPLSRTGSKLSGPKEDLLHRQLTATKREVELMLSRGTEFLARNYRF